MHEGDADHAIRKLDGAVGLDKELMVSRVGLPNEDELGEFHNDLVVMQWLIVQVVGPLAGYQPRRKQVLEVRKLFEGLQVGEVSLFYELEANPPAPGEDLFEKYVPSQV